MKAPRLAALALVPVVATLAACGGDSEKGGTSDRDNGVAAKPAKQIVADAASALERTRSVHLEGTQTIESKQTDVRADLEQPTNINIDFKQKGSSFSLIVVGESVYIKANASFWREQGAGGAGQELANRWFKAPASQKEFRELTNDVDIETLSRCLVKNHGTLEVGGKTTVNGQPAVVVVDKGDRPGTGPGKLFVATTGEPLPLRAEVTGTQRPGGPRDPQCNDPNSRARSGDAITFSRYNEDLKIEAPSGAVDLEAPEGQVS